MSKSLLKLSLRIFIVFDLGFKKGDLPQSEDYYSKAISLPIFPTITENEQDMVVNSLNEIINC